MKILLLGRHGQVGWELWRALAPLGSVVALGRNTEGELRGDLSDVEALVRTVRAVKPDVIVNAAAYTAVDKAEAEPELARAVNAEAPGVLAREARKVDAWLVHYSSDYVFDGSGEHPWKETDTPRPINVYGTTKYEGELAVRESGCRHVILRTSWVYAPRGSNFLRTILRLAQERESLRVVNDQIGAPTGAELIADVTAHVLPLARQDPRLVGTYHLAAAGQTSWHSYARFIIECAGTVGGNLEAVVGKVEPITTPEFPTPARRPQNSRLDCDTLRRVFGLHLPDWRTGVKRAVAELCLRALG